MSIEAEVCADIAARQVKGLKKYGMTVIVQRILFELGCRYDCQRHRKEWIMIKWFKGWWLMLVFLGVTWSVFLSSLPFVLNSHKARAEGTLSTDDVQSHFRDQLKWMGVKDYIACTEWAFGDCWETNAFKNVPQLWNARHSDLFVMRPEDLVDEDLKKVAEAYRGNTR